MLMQTAIIGDTEVIWAKDQDLFEPPAQTLLQRAGIEILDGKLNRSKLAWNVQRSIRSSFPS